MATPFVTVVPAEPPQAVMHPKPQETRILVWNNIDQLFDYLLDFVQVPEMGLRFRDVQWVMAKARWQVRHRGRLAD